jgi:hypothetical protein
MNPNCGGSSKPIAVVPAFESRFFAFGTGVQISRVRKQLSQTGPAAIPRQTKTHQDGPISYAETGEDKNVVGKLGERRVVAKIEGGQDQESSERNCEERQQRSDPSPRSLVRFVVHAG